VGIKWKLIAFRAMVERFARCFTCHPSSDLIEHAVPTLVLRRVFGIALGYEDLINRDELRHDSVMAAETVDAGNQHFLP
jgi:hypothetical protein